jgi:mono/diheme cytochrome c family protein
MILAVIVAVVIVGLVFAWKMFSPGPTAFAGGSTVALSDYHAADPTGVPADLANSDVVKRGEYLARAADCMVCHTAPDGAQYAGGLAFVTPFGTLYSTNITPDKETGIGNYSDQDFLNAVQHGVRRDGARLYPAMPFPSYTYMTDNDALAIKAYFFSLPAVHAAAVENTLSGTTRRTPQGVMSMPAFGSAYSDMEIAAVANYVTTRFGAEPSKLTKKDVAELRRQAAD